MEFCCPAWLYRLRSVRFSVRVEVSRTMKYHLGEYKLDPSTYSLCRGSTPAPVSRKRFEVLLYLVKERHRVVTRHELVEQFWEGHEVYEENLTKCISELRRALGDQQKPHRCIETIPAVGYRYIGVVEKNWRRRANPSLLIARRPKRRLLPPKSCRTVPRTLPSLKRKASLLD